MNNLWMVVTLSLLNAGWAVADTGTKGAGTVIEGGGQALEGHGVTRGSLGADGGEVKPGINVSGGAGGSGGSGQVEKAPSNPVTNPPSASAFTPKAASSSTTKIQQFVSNSASGPWLENGAVCNSGTVYSRTTGVDRAHPPRGCASPVGAAGCNDPVNHRDFTSGEWVDAHTIQTVVNGADYPPGVYALYLSYSKTDIRKIGTATLKSCAVPCRWTSRDFVVGPCGGPNCDGRIACTTGNEGAQGRGGGGMWTCSCH